MKKIFLPALLFIGSLAANAADVNLPSSPFVWSVTNVLANDGDKVIVKNGEELTIDHATAQNVSIEVQGGAKCIIQDISNATGETIEVAYNGTLQLEPKAGTDITIGQDIVVKGVELPATIDETNIMTLTALQSGRPAMLTIVDNGNYPKITFAGDLTIEQGGFFDIKYPATETASQIEFSNLYFKAEVLPLEFVPFLKMLLPAGYENYANYLNPGVIPPGILFMNDSKLPAITGGIYPTLEVRECILNIPANIRLMLTGMGITLPNDGTYMNNTIDLGEYSKAAPNSFKQDVTLTLIVPKDDTYTATLPQITSDAGKWLLTDNEDAATKIDLSDATAANRKYSIDLSAGTTDRLVIKLEESNPPTSLDYGQYTDEVASITYYTLAGVSVVNPQSGLYIAKIVYKSGKTETVKMFLTK